MRVVFNPPEGFRSVNSICVREDGVYVLCTRRLAAGGTMMVHVCNLTTGETWNYAGNERASVYSDFLLVDGEFCIGVSDATVYCLRTRKQVKFHVAASLDFRDQMAWRKLWYTARASDKFYRATGTDTHVFMTGSGAKACGEIVMGPTQAKSVLKTKGLSRGCVVMYKRGGDARVMKLPDRSHNPVGVIAASDSLTFYAVCAKAIYQIDADVE
jgi:hypothetical protein